MRDQQPSDSPTFGDALRCARRSRGLTQEALAERAGVSVRAISDLERGARTHPYRETAARLADALGLTGRDRAAWLALGRRPTPTDLPVAPTPRPSFLPAPLTRLIGRDDACRDITRLLRDNRIRLLTLTGPAGVGKTSLAATVAASLGDAFRDGIVVVDLAALEEPSLVVPAVATALQITDQGSISLIEAVRRRLRARQMLLVLDNFEHLLPAAPVLSDLLHAAPGVQVLVTSRAALRLRSERAYPVVPLRTPISGRHETIGAIGQPLNSSSSGRKRWRRDSDSRRRMLLRSLGFAGGSMDYRWPSNWRQLGSRSCRQARCCNDSSDGSHS